jgi:hypothetical protein
MDMVLRLFDDSDESGTGALLFCIFRVSSEWPFSLEHIALRRCYSWSFKVDDLMDSVRKPSSLTFQTHLITFNFITLSSIPGHRTVQAYTTLKKGSVRNHRSE